MNVELNRRAAKPLCWNRCKTDCGQWYFDADGTELLEVNQWFPCTDLNQATLLESEVARRGLQCEYVTALLEQEPPGRDYKDYNGGLFFIATAPAEARVRAAVETLEANRE